MAAAGSWRRLDGGATGAIGDWLDNARGVYRDHRDEIDAQPDREARVNRFVECNVRDQLVRLARTSPIQRAFEQRDLALHGWVYDLRDGLIKSLMEIDRTTDLEESAGRRASWSDPERGAAGRRHPPPRTYFLNLPFVSSEVETPLRAKPRSPRLRSAGPSTSLGETGQIR
jgi:hypothetical protein